jgi:hypothetical protein
MNILPRSIAVLALLLPILSTAAGADTAPPLTRVGIVPLRDDGNVRNGAQRLTSMLAARLAARFEETEFFVIELDDTDPPEGPLLLAEAVELCRETGADALVDGVFGGIEVVGGTWPNKGGDHPQARGFLRWRLVDGVSGLLITDGVIDPDKPQVYSQRVRTLKQLQTRVLQDLADAVVEELEGCERLPGGEEEDS